jgi:hypothetical protein
MAHNSTKTQIEGQAIGGADCVERSNAGFAKGLSRLVSLADVTIFLTCMFCR